jgi:hypothetical protein
MGASVVAVGVSAAPPQAARSIDNPTSRDIIENKYFRVFI